MSNDPQYQPPRLATRLLLLFLKEDMIEEVTGDLDEKFEANVHRRSLFRAQLNYWWQVLGYLRPFAIRSSRVSPKAIVMFRNYLKTGLRNSVRHPGYSLLNIGGLAMGLSIAMLIGLWIHDELSFDQYHQHHERIGRIWVNHHFGNEISTQRGQPYPVAQALRNEFSDFDAVAGASWNYGHFLSWEDQKRSVEGMFADPDFINLVSLNMITGSNNALNDRQGIVISESLAQSLFGSNDPMGKVIKIDRLVDVHVTGIFEDFPENSSFKTTKWIATMDLYIDDYRRSPRDRMHWGDYSFQIFTRLNENADRTQVNERIKDLITRNNERADSKPEIFIQPMDQWHLYSAFTNGVNTGGEIEFVWLFGIIGSFVLLLACINFMNLSTALSAKRSKEIGLRKVVGSGRSQLVFQFLTESLLIVFTSMTFAVFFVILFIGQFNELTGKHLSIPWSSTNLWLACLSFAIVTGLVAGGYPAFFLSSFNPVRALKGTLRIGQSSTAPRKILVVLQFVVSVVLVTGTAIVYLQINHARNRPLGFNNSGLVTTYGYPFADKNNAPNKYDALKQSLINTGAVIATAKSSSPTTAIYSYQSDFDWEGRDVSVSPNFGVVWCSHDFLTTIGAQMAEGRTFSREYASDTAAVVLNRVAAEMMNLTNPVGATIQFNHIPYNVIGITENMLIESPYSAPGPLAYFIDYSRAGIIQMKINPELSPRESIVAIEKVFHDLNPESIFEYQFADDQFNRKFDRERRSGWLGIVFTAFAIVISCLGLLGLTAFVAEQRTKEFGIRKVVGASVISLWALMSREFITLVVIATVIAIPLSYYGMAQWLSSFEYRINLSWWIFAGAGALSIAITLIVVSYQALRAAKMDPVKSLKSE